MKKLLLVSLFTTTLIASGSLAAKSSKTTETKYTFNDGNKILIAQAGASQSQSGQTQGGQTQGGQTQGGQTQGGQAQGGQAQGGQTQGGQAQGGQTQGGQAQGGQAQGGQAQGGQAQGGQAQGGQAQGGQAQGGQGMKGGQVSNKASDSAISSPNRSLPSSLAKDQAPADSTSNLNITTPDSSNSTLQGATATPATSSTPTTSNTPNAPTLTGPAPLSVGPNTPTTKPSASDGSTATPANTPTPTDATTSTPASTPTPTDATKAPALATPTTSTATAAPLPASDSNANQLTVQPATVKFKGKNAAIYLTLTNGTSSPITLTDISTPGPEGKGCKAVLHRRAVDEEGTASMDEVGQLTINPGGSLDFAQEGLHVMLTRCAKTPKVGSTFNLVLTFDSGSTQNVPVDVVSKMSK